MRLSILPAGLLALGCALAADQPRFEAADVHASPQGTRTSWGFLPNGRAEFHSVTMLHLISVAYSVPAERISGGPNWVSTDRFEVVAKAAGKPAAAAMRAMLQTLLAERFDLAVKQEEKPLPVYTLVVRKPGVLKHSASQGDPDCQSAMEENVRIYTCRNVPMDSVAARLMGLAPGYFPKPLMDRTGLEGTYDFRLEFMGKGMAAGRPEMHLFRAVEKLGLAVEEGTAPQPVATIERVNRTPTPNDAGVEEKVGAAPTEFDVATIKLSRPEETEDFRVRNGVLEARAFTLQGLIAAAYDIERDWVKGREKWIETERFDVMGKTEPTLSVEALRAMLRKLLEDRFELKVHKETQPVPVYALTAVKPKLKEADPSGRAGCQWSNPDLQTLTCRNATMALFAERIENYAGGYLDKPVVDLTGLTGRYDFVVAWLAKKVVDANRPVAAPPGATAPETSGRALGPTVFEAVEKQLGLKLAAQKHPMPVIVIEQANRKPAEN
jgi:uncharacterized protein (TIGR03435 family)